MVLADSTLITATEPRELKYMRMLRFMLRLMGSWPGRYLGEDTSKYETVPAVALGVVCTICVYGTTMYLRKYSPLLSFYDIGHSYITVIVSAVCVTRLVTLPLSKKYREIIKKFVNEMHLFYFRHISEFNMKTHIEVHKISYFFAIYLNALLCGGPALFNIFPLYHNYVKGNFKTENQNVSFILAIYFEFPFDITTNYPGYIIISIWNWYASMACSICLMMYDLLLFVMIFHVRGHFKILIHNLKNFPIPAQISCDSGTKRDVLAEVQCYSAGEMVVINKTLKECIDYHRVLIKFTDEISEVFGSMLFFSYLFHQIVECLLLLEISQMNTEAIIMYGPVTVGLFSQLIQMSFIVESVGTVTGKLKDAVYSTPWQYMDTKNRRIVLIFLMNVQEPLHINALGLAKVGVTSMATILKTSLSYFAFLRTITD